MLSCPYVGASDLGIKDVFKTDYLITITPSGQSVGVNFVENVACHQKIKPNTDVFDLNLS